MPLSLSLPLCKSFPVPVLQGTQYPRSLESVRISPLHFRRGTRPRLTPIKGRETRRSSPQGPRCRSRYQVFPVWTSVLYRGFVAVYGLQDSYDTSPVGVTCGLGCDVSDRHISKGPSWRSFPSRSRADGCPFLFVSTPLVSTRKGGLHSRPPDRVSGRRSSPPTYP